MKDPVVEIAVYLAATQVSHQTGVPVMQCVERVRDAIALDYMNKFITADTLDWLVSDVVARIGPNPSPPHSEIPTLYAASTGPIAEAP